MRIANGLNRAFKTHQITHFETRLTRFRIEISIEMNEQHPHKKCYIDVSRRFKSFRWCEIKLQFHILIQTKLSIEQITHIVWNRWHRCTYMQIREPIEIWRHRSENFGSQADDLWFRNDVDWFFPILDKDKKKHLLFYWNSIIYEWIVVCRCWLRISDVSEFFGLFPQGLTTEIVYNISKYRVFAM